MQEELFIHSDISLFRFVIPGLTRNPVFSWIPAFAEILNRYIILHLESVLSNKQAMELDILQDSALCCQIKYGAFARLIPLGDAVFPAICRHNLPAKRDNVKIIPPYLI